MSGWRERRDPVRPTAVRAVVRAVRRTLLATRAVESALLLVAAALLVRAAMVAGETQGPGGWGVALLAGALAAAAWWLEHPVPLVATARALDERLRHHGGLVTAFEVEERADAARTPMEELVRERVLARLRQSEALRAILPPLAVPVGAPVAAALLLLLATDARRAPERVAADLGALADGLGRALRMESLDPGRAGIPGEDEDGGLSRSQVQELQRVLAARGTLPRDAAGFAADPRAAERVEALDRSVAALAAEVDPSSELHARLDEARTWLDALRMGLADPGDPAGRPGPGGPGEGQADGALTAARGDGTMSGSRPPREPARMPSENPLPPDEPPGAALPAGLRSGSWWPAEYDEVVAAWVELSRAARSNGGGAAPR